MADIVERLRDADIGWSGDAACVDADTAEEGAKEIERLRAVLLNIQAMAETGFLINGEKLAERCRHALNQPAKNPDQQSEKP